MLTHRLQHRSHFGRVRFTSFNSCLRTGCNAPSSRHCGYVFTFNSCLRTGCNGLHCACTCRHTTFNSCLRTGCNLYALLVFTPCSPLQLVLTHRLQPNSVKPVIAKTSPSTRAYAQVATKIREIKKNKGFTFNSCLRTGCNEESYCPVDGYQPSTRAYAQVATG